MTFDDVTILKFSTKLFPHFSPTPKLHSKIHLRPVNPSLNSRIVRTSDFHREGSRIVTQHACDEKYPKIHWNRRAHKICEFPSPDDATLAYDLARN